MASARLVEFGRQGGIAGVSDQVVIREDGGLTVVRGHPAVNRTGGIVPELRPVIAALSSILSR